MVVLARSDKPLRLVDLRRHMRVSEPYLFYMLKELCGAGLLKKEAKWRAGYSLGRPADGILLKEVTEAVDSSLYAENSKSRKTLSGEFFEVLLWKRFCRDKLGECSVADVPTCSV